MANFFAHNAGITDTNCPHRRYAENLDLADDGSEMYLRKWVERLAHSRGVTVESILTWNDCDKTITLLLDDKVYLFFPPDMCEFEALSNHRNRTPMVLGANTSGDENETPIYDEEYWRNLIALQIRDNIAGRTIIPLALLEYEKASFTQRARNLSPETIERLEQITTIQRNYHHAWIVFMLNVNEGEIPGYPWIELCPLNGYKSSFPISEVQGLPIPLPFRDMLSLPPRGIDIVDYVLANNITYRDSRTFRNIDVLRWGIDVQDEYEAYVFSMQLDGKSQSEILSNVEFLSITGPYWEALALQRMNRELRNRDQNMAQVGNVVAGLLTLGIVWKSLPPNTVQFSFTKKQIQVPIYQMVPMNGAIGLQSIFSATVKIPSLSINAVHVGSLSTAQMNNLGQAIHASVSATGGGGTPPPDLPISESVLKHINNRHNPSAFAQQLKYMPKENALKTIENKSFFNMNWSRSQIESAVNYGFNDAIQKGITDGQHTFTFAGETVTVAMLKGEVQTAWGSWKFTYEQLFSLLAN